MASSGSAIEGEKSPCVGWAGRGGDGGLGVAVAVQRVDAGREAAALALALASVFRKVHYQEHFTPVLHMTQALVQGNLSECNEMQRK